VEAAQLAVRIVELIIFGSLALISVRRWRKDRHEAALWWTATIGILALVVVASFLIPVKSNSDLASWERKFLVAVLLLFPYTLFRYGRHFVQQVSWLRRAAEVATAIVIVWTFLLPKLEGEGAPRTTALMLFTVGILIQWTALSSITTVRLWRAGRRQSSVARNRMRLMAAASALLNFTLIVSAFLPNEPDSAWPLVGGALGIVSALLFFAGYVPPRALRVIWRSPDVELLRQAELSLMSVMDPAEIGSALLPHVSALFGAQGSMLADRNGAVLAASGLTSAEARAAATIAAHADEPSVVQEGLLAVKLHNGYLAVRGSAVSPFFGREEVDLLVALGLFTDLALERASLFELERYAREEAERANAELETFVYSVSHDLKSPLVSLLGFLDYLKADLHGSQSEEVDFYLDRISAAGMYMQALIQDLLELSRIGRVQTEPSEIDLGLVLREIVDEQEGLKPEATFALGPLPVIEMNPLRVRQLFTNLIGNALTHAGRNDVNVVVESVEAPDGSVVVSVADNGKGIPPGYREKIFGVFERLERHDAHTTGTGIGLAVCRKIVEQYGGQLDVTDNSPGARFSIRFPAAVVRRGPSRLETAR
jgi:signal transduction histidine kinase